MALPKRKSNRLTDFDYSTNGCYFITICTANKQKILCNIVGCDALDAPKTLLTQQGKIVEKYIKSSNNIPQITVCKYVIMPNHIHILLKLHNSGINGTSKAPSPTNKAIPHFVSTLKRFVNRDCGVNIFQRSFYDHIIRDENDYLKIWNYIDTNPHKWAEDKYYVNG